MKWIILIALCLMCFAGTASAYGVYLSCPESVQVGLPLKCSIDSDFPGGMVLDFVFYRMQDTATEVSRQSFTVQDNKITQYKVFDTTNLPGGNYKVEFQYTGPNVPQLRSDSKTLQLVKLIGSSSETTVQTTVPTAVITTIPTTIFTTQHTTAITTNPTTASTTVPTTINTPTPTATVNYSATIAAMQSQIAEQGAKITEQGNVLDQIMTFLRTVFGWK